MKRLHLVIWACLFYCQIFCQDFSTTFSNNENVGAEIEYVLSDLDMSYVTSGILQDRSIPMGYPELYGPSTEADDVYCSMTLLSIQYEGMYAASLPNTNIIESSSDAFQTELDNYVAGSMVPLKIMAFEYQKFKEEAVDDGLLTISGGKLHYGTSNPSDAYDDKKLFHSGFFTNTWELSSDIRLNTDDFIGNFEVDENSIFIDFDNGQGYQQINVGSLMNVSYTSEGEYIIKLKFKDVDGEDIVHYHNINVFNSALSIKETKGQSTDRGLPLGITCSSAADYCRTITVNGETVMYSVKLACPGGSTDLKKPFVILDGIDLLWDQNTFSFDSLLEHTSQGLNFSNSQVLGGTKLGEILELGGYDVIFVDYFDHHIRIQDNAAVVEEVIRDINDQLALNNSTEPIKMMGISMGGIVGKYALLEMEDNGEQHNVDRYFTFDSPMQGANVPVSLQALVPHILKVSVPTIFYGSPTIVPLRLLKLAEPLVFFENVLKSPAARQLAQINIFNGSGIPGYDWDGVDMNQEFFDELDALGELEQAEMYAISNGSDSGSAGQVLKIDGSFLLASQIIYSFDDDLVTTIVGSTPASIIQSLEVSFETSKGNFISAPLLYLPALPIIIRNVLDIDLVGRAIGGAPGSAIYDGKVEMSLFFGLVKFGPKFRVENLALSPSLDGCPGGTLGNSLVPFMGPLFTALPTGLTLTTTDLCFIPTVSALDIQGTDANGDNMLDNLLIDLSDGNTVNTVYDGFIAEDESISGFAPAPAMVNNNSHVSLTRDNVLLLVDELMGNLDLTLEGLPHILSSKFNYGDSGNGTQVINGVQVPGKTSSILPNDYTIVEGGAIFVNDENRINYMDDPVNPYNMNNSFFSVEVVNQGCSSNTGVVFDYRGLLEIGDYSASNVGELIINDETSVTLEKESNTIINTDSKIIVRDGGLLHIKEGANVELLGDCQIIIEPGGKLIFNENANLILEDYGDISDVNKGSKIVIAGELEFIGTRLNAKGKGSFVFNLIEEINIPSKELTITRDGDRIHEVLQVKGAVYIDGVKVTVEECKIKNAGSIDLTNAENFVVRNADIETGQIITFFIDEVTMEHSKFYNEASFNFHNADNVKSFDNHYYDRSDVSVFDCFRGSFTSDDFELNSKIQVQDMGNYILFKDCKMNAYDFGISDIDADYLDRDGVAISAIRNLTVNPYSIILDNTEVKYFEYGIGVGKEGLTSNGLNIFLRNQTTLIDNHYGVYMRGDETTGMVEMQCSNLIDNQIGIKGVDILLNIDAVLHAMSGDGIIRPNKFIYDSNKPTGQPFFDICYQKKNIQGDIPANGNYWRIGYFNRNTPYNYSDYKIKKSASQSSCLGSQDLALIVNEIIEDEPFGCPPPGPITPNCPLSVEDIGTVNFNDIINNSPDFKILDIYKDEFCFSDDLCNSDYSLHGHYWAGHQCIDLNSFESAVEFFDPIAWSQFEDFEMSIYCKQQSLFAAHIINGYSGDPQQSQESFTIFEECDDNTIDFFFLLDASGSVDNVEYDLMVESVINTLKDINIGENRFAVANFAASNTFDLIVPFTSELADTVNIVRTLNGGTNVYDAFVKTKDYISSESSDNQQKIVLYTDASSGQFHTPPFDIYNEIKSSPISAEVFVIRYQTGFPSSDNYANQISAAIASKGGTWSGPIANNPDDPQGSGGPRKFLAEAFSGSVPLLTEDLISCDTLTVTIPADCVNPLIEWTSSDGGQILGDSINVETIVTNGLGSYSVNVTCGDGCTYTIDYGNSAPNGERGNVTNTDYTRYRNGVKVNPHDFETLLSNDDIEESSKYGIYPNPVRETLYLTDLSNDMLIELYDVRGRKVLSFENVGDKMSIDVENIVKGIYFLQLSDLKIGNQEMFKIVVLK